MKINKQKLIYYKKIEIINSFIFKIDAISKSLIPLTTLIILHLHDFINTLKLLLQASLEFFHVNYLFF